MSIAKTLGMFKTMKQLLTTAEFASNFNCKHILTVGNLDIILISRRPRLFLVDLEQVFNKIFYV